MKDFVIKDMEALVERCSQEDVKACCFWNKIE